MQAPAGPLLAGLEVGLAGVHQRVEVAERLRDGLDALPVGAGDRVQGAAAASSPALYRSTNSFGPGQQLVGLVLRRTRRSRRAAVDQLRVVGGDLDDLAGPGDGELLTDALALHARLAGGGTEGACWAPSPSAARLMLRTDVLHLGPRSAVRPHRGGRTR